MATPAIWSAQMAAPSRQEPHSPTAAPVGLGVWNHVAWTYDQSAMKLYLNGAPVATNLVGPHAIFAGSSRLRIGADDNNTTHFDGSIDEPSVYNRALSASEIAAIYNA